MTRDFNYLKNPTALFLLVSFSITGTLYSSQLLGLYGLPAFGVLVVLSYLVGIRLQNRRYENHRKVAESTSTSVFWARRSAGSSNGTLTVDGTGLSLRGPHRLPESVLWQDAVDVRLHRKVPLPFADLYIMTVRLTSGREVSFEVGDGHRLVEALRDHAPRGVVVREA
jgi:hypothetical protein